MKKILISFFLLGVSFGFSQDLVLIKFTDKPDAAAYLADPLLMLSQKALDRKAKYGIPIEESDVPADEDYILQIKDLGINPIASSRWFNGVFAWITEAEAIQAENLPFVEGIESFVRNPEGGKYEAPAKFITNGGDSVSEELQPETINYGVTETQITQINLNYLHDLGFTGEGITIAVMDNGFPGVDTREAFRYLRENNKLKGGYNFVDDNDDIYGSGSHGTMVLSTIGGYIENQFVGTAIDSDYYLFITEDNTHEMPDEEVFWIAAAEMADSIGVDVINTSLGYSKFDDSRYNYVYADMNGETTFISRGAQWAAEKGIMVVVSAGNEGNKNWHYITAPADAKDVFTIGAVDAWGNMAGFSSYGPTSDGRIKPDVDALGVNASVIRPSGEMNNSSGTSFSSPITAGAMACLIEAQPEKHPEYLREKVRESADHYLNPTDHYGYGIPDFGDAYEKCLGLKEFDKIDYVTVYPNPTTGQIYIKSEKAIRSLQLISFEGKIIRRPEVSNSLDLSGLPKGVYLLKVGLENGKTEVKKIIKK